MRKCPRFFLTNLPPAIRPARQADIASSAGFEPAAAPPAAIGWRARHRPLAQQLHGSRYFFTGAAAA
jgi:hypothetical protein